MLEVPDSRFLVLFAITAILFVGAAFVSPESPLHSAAKAVQYLGVAIFGLSVAVIELREGRCLNRPSITRESDPASFYMEVFVAVLVSGFALYMWTQIAE